MVPDGRKATKPNQLENDSYDPPLVLTHAFRFSSFSSFSVFCFAYMVEGASGFGTPVALGAPILVNSGHPAFESVVVLLAFNTFATVWGAVGTPIWFGLGNLGLTEDELLEVSQKAGVALAVGAFVLMPWVLSVLAPVHVIKANLPFIYFSLITVVGPSVAMSSFSYEFPSLIGGIIGCAGTALLISKKVGLKEFTPEPVAEPASEEEDEEGNKPKPAAPSGEEDDADDVDPAKDNEDDKNTDPATAADVTDKNNILAAQQAADDAHLGPRKTAAEGYYQEMLARTFPIWAVVVLLIVTRIEEIGLKEQLKKTEPSFSIYFGSYGTFSVSASLVLSLTNILSYPNLNWSYQLLYVPCLIPFILVSVLTMIVYRKDMKSSPLDIAKTAARRLKNPAYALMGALVLVQMLIRSGTAAPAFILGTILADWFEQAFVIICPLLGCLGAFFSGSTTVSNLTFASIQRIAAESIGVSTTTMLALQAVGGSCGNGVCLNNIIAGCAIVGLDTGCEGKILRQTYKFVFANTTIATIVMLAFYFRF
jgi:lactate permease